MAAFRRIRASARQHLRSILDAIKRDDEISSRRVKQQAQEQPSNVIALLRGSCFFFMVRRAKTKLVRDVVGIVGAGIRRIPS